MVGYKVNLITDLFVAKHHCEYEKDRKTLDWVIKWFRKNLETVEDYEPQYPECCNDPWPNPYVGKECFVISDNCRLPKGTKCVVEQYVIDELADKNYYIRNLDSAYCCWASAEDLKFLS